LILPIRWFLKSDKLTLLDFQVKDIIGNESLKLVIGAMCRNIVMAIAGVFNTNAFKLIFR
jgi:hypothetical protein